MRLIVAKDYADVRCRAANIIAARIHLHPGFTLAANEAALELVKDLIALHNRLKTSKQPASKAGCFLYR